ncbi:MAG TPA: xylan 1,4-beta-xylosidase [Bacteroidales bacterium]|nr:xylan 1,4-beta-xylosidase [Bacteroidales bacterium]
MKTIQLTTACLLLTLSIWAQQFPYQNPNLSADERAKDLISRLTLEEKASLMTDQSDAIPRLGIKRFNWWSEALHGFANNSDVTVFPQPIGMAASFDEALVYEVFNATSDEVRAKYHYTLRNNGKDERFMSLSVWTPNINIFRDPRWGRGPETYGEDPYLTTRMGISVVKGLQGDENSKYKKLLACAKHYAVHSGPEWSRHTLNVNNLDPRDLRETYLPAFKALVQQADVRQVMCAYQSLDDEPCCGNSRLLQKILRDEWGYKYLVVSDCDAIADFAGGHKVSSDALHAAVKGSLAGTDVECAWATYLYKNLTEAVSRGLVTEADIDKHLMRIITGRISLGEMDDEALVPWTKIPFDVVNSDKHRKLALKMAHETMTLLQNKNNILPLSKSIKKVAVIGPNANDEVLMWGSYNGVPVQTITILDGIKSLVPAKNIVYDKGCHLIFDKNTKSAINECLADNKPGFKVTYWNNREFTGDVAATGHIQFPFQLRSTGQHEFYPGLRKKDFSGKFETVYKPSESGEISFKLEVCGGVYVCINGDTIKEVQSWKPMFAKASYKVEKNKEYHIVLYYKQNDNWPAMFGFDFGKEEPVNYDAFLKKLQGIDVVIFAGGISSELEGEEMPMDLPGFKGGDRTHIELPEVQRNCLKALKKAGKKVVFINCSGSAIALTPETESCDAILQAWYAGQEGGRAIADVIFGDYNPSGKLPVTFYKNSDQLMDIEDYSMKGRTYRFMNDALFSFGFGLSYTTFSIGDATFSSTRIRTNEAINITIPVTNTGKRNGTEVVQVYVRKVNDTDGPLKTLKGFERIDVAAGQTGKAAITLPYNSFEFYDRASGEMTVEAGDYEVMYGNSSEAKDLKMTKVFIE